MKVDVVMCTWNSNKPYFVKCLNSIKREVPVHHFILVDKFSKDGTIETVRKVFLNAKIVRSNARLGVSRKLGIEQVDTEFFVFVDSDIELCNGWFKRIIRHLDSRTGAIQGSCGLCIYPLKHLTAWAIWSRNIQARFREAFARKVAIGTSKNPDVLKGDPSNTLLRTCLVKDYNPPAILSAADGHLLQRCVIRKGYMWKGIRDPIVTHYGISSLKYFMRNCRWEEAGIRLVENTSMWSLMRDALTQCICALVASLQTKQSMILPYVTLQQLARVQGWTRCVKYLELKR